MAVTGVSTINTTSIKLEASYKQSTVTAASAASDEAAKAGTATELQGKTDSFVKSEPTQEIGYGNIAKGLSADQVQELSDQRLNSLKSMVEKLISQQADKSNNIISSDFTVKFSLEITSTTATEGTGSFYDDPNWGVDAMASKLMDMAMSLSGGDSSKAETLLAAVEKGFKEAGAAWGDELPGVCKATLDEVRNRFDYWKNNGSLDGYVMQGYTNYDEE